MNRISKLLTARDILLDVPATSKKRLFEHAALLFENEHRLERQKVFDSLFARERLGSTGLGKAVAIPHGRAPALDKPRGALLRLEQPVDFGGSEPVDLVFAIAVPAHYTHQHLMLLSELAELFSAPAIRQALRDAGDARALRQALDLPPPASAA